MFLNARLFPAPLAATQSLFRRLQTMHQQPPHAPRSPNRRSMSFHRDGVALRKVSSEGSKLASGGIAGPVYFKQLQSNAVGVKRNRTPPGTEPCRSDPTTRSREGVAP